MAVARMRTIDGLYREIHEGDPDSEISKHFLRQLVKSGKVKTVKAGNKFLTDLDNVLQYLSDPPVEPEEEQEYGKLRKIT